MHVHDEIALELALGESRACVRRIERIRRDREAAARGSADPGPMRAQLTLTLAIFQVHGASLRRLLGGHPDESRVRLAAIEWELLSARVGTRPNARSIARESHGGR